LLKILAEWEREELALLMLERRKTEREGATAFKNDPKTRHD
jgi:hypothetical protein